MSKLWLLVGLGNPGNKYSSTRHNIGFDAVDLIAEKYGFSPFKQAHEGQVCRGKIAENDILLLKPQTFMNLSGESVGDAARFYKIDLNNIIIFHDEMALPVGKLRLKNGGGHAGHNGLKSVDAHIGQEYWRVRIGIDHPGDKDQVTDYVLSSFRPEEKSVMEKIIRAIADEIPNIFLENKDKFGGNIATIMTT